MSSGSLISNPNSFIQFNASAPPDPDPCEDTVPFCLPMANWGDAEVQIPLTSTENPPTVVVKIKVGGTSTTIDTLDSTKISSETTGGSEYWLTVDSNCCDIALLLATLNVESPSSYGTWSVDPATGDIKCTGDIHAFSEDLSSFGITYTIHCPCVLTITNAGEPAATWEDVQAYLQTNYPEYGAWTNIDPTGTPHTNELFATLDICGINVAAIEASLSITYPGFTISLSEQTEGCEMHIVSFDCADINVVDYLIENYSDIGTWAIVSGKITCSGDISSFSGTIPCVTYEIDNNGTTIYTHLFYGVLQDSGHAISTYVDPGECFSFTITFDGLTYESNCFIYTPSDCFTTKIKYRSNQNVFGFTYFIDNGTGGNLIAGIYNIVRLPIYIRHPSPKATETTYRRSDGTYELLSSIMENVWELVVDWLDRDNHRRLFVALGNNDFELYDDTAGVYTHYQKDGEYKIEWVKDPGINFNGAPATCMLKESPFFNFNSNCE